MRHPGLFNLSTANGFREETCTFKTVKFRLKIYLASHPAHIKGLLKTFNLRFYLSNKTPDYVYG